MDSILTALDAIWGLLLMAASVMVAFDRKDIRKAKALTWFGVVAFLFRWGLWAVTTEQSWWVRTIVVGVVGAFALGVIPAAFRWLSERESAVEVVKPNISLQKFALFWIRIDEEKYQLGVVTKLFDADGKSYRLNGISFNTEAWRLIPRGSYYWRQQIEFPDHIEAFEDDYIRANDVGYFKKKLPVLIELKIEGGVLPEFVLLGQWNLLMAADAIPVEPRFYAAYEIALTPQEWDDLLKPKSEINVDNLSYKPVPGVL